MYRESSEMYRDRSRISRCRVRWTEARLVADSVAGQEPTGNVGVPTFVEVQDESAVIEMFRWDFRYADGGCRPEAGRYGEGERGVDRRPETPRWRQVGIGSPLGVECAVFRGFGKRRRRGEVEGDAGEGAGHRHAGGLAPGLLQGPRAEEGRRTGGFGKREESAGLRREEVAAGDGLRAGPAVEALHIHADAGGLRAGGGGYQTAGVGDADGDSFARGRARVENAGRSGVGSARRAGASDDLPGRNAEQFAGQQANQAATDSRAAAGLGAAAEGGAPVVGGAEQRRERLVGGDGVRSGEQPHRRVDRERRRLGAPRPRVVHSPYPGAP